MGVEVKYHPDQDTDTEIVSVTPMPKGQFEKLIEKIFELFGLAKTKVTKAKGSKMGEKDDMTNEEFREHLKTHFNPSPKEAFKEYPSMYRISFLRNLIAGEFDGFTEELFDNKTDKKLFREFNALSKPDREAKYKELVKKLNDISLK